MDSIIVDNKKERPEGLSYGVGSIPDEVVKDFTNWLRLDTIWRMARQGRSVEFIMSKARNIGCSTNHKFLTSCTFSPEKPTCTGKLHQS